MATESTTETTTCPTTQATPAGNQPNGANAPQSTFIQPNVNTTVVVHEKKSNGLGTAGFVLSLIALVFGWVPGLGWFIWALGAILSFVGLFKRPRGLAITGFVISFFWLIVFAMIAGAISAFK